MMAASRVRHATRGGFSLIEMLIGMTLLMICLGGLATSLGRVQAASAEARSASVLQIDSQRAQLEIARDLERSGAFPLGPYEVPHLFEDGDPGPGFDLHRHAPAQSHAYPGDEDFGASQEIVFLLPADDDGDGRPDISVDGTLLWDLDEISYVLVTGADDRNLLERRVNGETDRVVARDVERLRFDDARSSGWELPLGTVRIRIWYRRTDANGELHLWNTDTLIALNSLESL